MNHESHIKLTDGKVLTNPIWALSIQAERANEYNLYDFQLSLWKWLKLLESKNIRFPARVKQEYLYLLPNAELEAYSPPDHRVIGLVVEHNSITDQKVGLVNPLIVNINSRGWVVSHTLPFQAGHIQDCLYRLLRESGLSIEDRVPELTGFSIREQLNELPTGSSMHVAGLIAVIDALNGKKSDLFRSVCAIVKPVENRLESVESIDTKLKGFRREYDKGSLLIRQKYCSEGEKWDSLFETVWEVNTFADLAHHLVNANQLNAVLHLNPFNKDSLESARTRIRWLCEEQKMHEALDFAERLERTVNAGEEPFLRVQQSVELELEELNRHLGRFDKAILHSRNAVESIESLSNISCYQELYDAKIRLGAALYDGHEFQNAHDLLSPLLGEIEENPQLVTAESQYMLFNTLGRVKVILGEHPSNWNVLFEKSIRLQEIVDTDNIARTRCYLIHGLLRHHQLDEAEREIQKASKSNPDFYSHSFITFYIADLHRRLGKNTFEDTEFEKLGNHVDGYLFGFYLQATARQTCRKVEDRVERFLSAANEFNKEAGQLDDFSLLRLFSSFMEYSAALVQEKQDEAVKTHTAIIEFLERENASALRDYYQELLPASDGTYEEMEKVLSAIPYF